MPPQDFESYMNESAPPDFESFMAGKDSGFESFMSTQGDSLTPWQKARQMAEQAGATGRMPIPTGPGILQGAKPDLGQMGAGLFKGAVNFIPDMVKMAGDFVKPLVNPGASLMEQGMAQAAAEKAKGMGVAPPEQPTSAGPLKLAMGLAEWWPQMMARFIKDPVGTANQDPFGVLVLATAGQGKQIKRWIEKKKAPQALTPADLKAAFNESGAKNAPPELAGAFDYLDKAEGPGVYGEGGAPLGESVPTKTWPEPRVKARGPTPMPEGAEFARPDIADMRVAEPAPAPPIPAQRLSPDTIPQETPGGGYPPTGKKTHPLETPFFGE